MKTADVFVNIPVKSIAQAYTYRVPEHLSQIAAGWRVFVPFGNRRVEGFVIRTHENAQAPKGDRKSTRLNSSHVKRSRMPSSA